MQIYTILLAQCFYNINMIELIIFYSYFNRLVSCTYGDKSITYTQIEFEKSMFFATDNCTFVAIAWPSILLDGKNYLERPW